MSSINYAFSLLSNSANLIDFHVCFCARSPWIVGQLSEKILLAHLSAYGVQLNHGQHSPNNIVIYIFLSVLASQAEARTIIIMSDARRLCRSCSGTPRTESSSGSRKRMEQKANFLRITYTHFEYWKMSNVYGLLRWYMSDQNLNGAHMCPNSCGRSMRLIVCPL